MCRYELPCLYERIRTVMRAEKCSVERAVEQVYAAIAADPAELQRWWEGMGVALLKLAEAKVWDMGGPDHLKPRCEDPGVVVPVRAPEPAARSWREKVNPLNIPIPVGATGVTKRLGAFTREDLVLMRDYYLERGRKMIAEGEKWGAVAERMGEDETLEQALPRLMEEDQDLLPEKLKAALPNPVLT